MRADLLPVAPPAALDTLTVDQNEAARLTNLSAKTLGRLADAGEPVGRVKIGRRVLYHRAKLSAWLLARAEGKAVVETGSEPSAH
ncbi:MAG: helix-turn-helix domain-containing protein [Planctomycetes bacterium]|nr:helix-turn-helix domain-containing protein [Planctomycetota bacterium]